MNTVVARVLRVLTGHSPTAMIHAVDEHGHEHKLEVPSESTRGVEVGRLLVLQWSVHSLPGVLDSGAAVGVLPAAASEPHAPAASASSSAIAGVIDDNRTSEEAAQLEALLGLRPGRVGGAGPASATQSLEETFGIRLSGEPRRT
jgi:hypothetical protein